MADYPPNAPGSSSPGSPGIGGAISDAADALRKTLFPKKERTYGQDHKTEREITDDSQVASNPGRQAQSSDASNRY